MMADTAAQQKKSVLPALAILALAGLFIVVVLVFVFHPGYEQTNDAQIDGHIHPINARIAGTITWVNPSVEDTRSVKAGTVLARLDPDDYQPTVDRLRAEVEASDAQLSNARLQMPIIGTTALSRLDEARANVLDAQADLAAAQAQELAANAAVGQARAVAKRAEDDRARYEALLPQHDISRSEYEQRATDARSTAEQLAVAEANSQAAGLRVQSAKEKLAEKQSELNDAQTAPQRIAAIRAGVERAQGEVLSSRAALKRAELDLSYTQIVAPIDGIVGRRSVEVGQRVTVGELLLTLVPPDDVWTTANFREDQLEHMRVGQSVRVHVDAYDADVDGTIESFGGATGSKYSLISPDNATGNFVKVVQRLPVRIRLQSDQVGGRPLLPGMSVEARVKI